MNQSKADFTKTSILASPPPSKRLRNNRYPVAYSAPPKARFSIVNIFRNATYVVYPSQHLNCSQLDTNKSVTHPAHTVGLCCSSSCIPVSAYYLIKTLATSLDMHDPLPTHKPKNVFTFCSHCCLLLLVVTHKYVSRVTINTSGRRIVFKNRDNRDKESR